MSDWLKSLKEILAMQSSAVLVTVMAVDGSVPREIGATLVVSANNQSGTIGGGNLEYTAISYAREMLASVVTPLKRECQTLSLGPSLGQCCGGRVELLYEYVTTSTGWITDIEEHLNSGSNNICFYRCLDNNEVFIAKAGSDRASAIMPANLVAGVGVSSIDGNRWFCMPLKVAVPDIWIFGAGHVGMAVVAQLNLLPCRITWLDHREEWLAQHPQLAVTRVLSDTLADEINSAPASAYFVVMTHSHAIDFDICHAVLRREQFAWLGLIGSATKLQTFNSRLSQRGISEDLIQQIRCPIGQLPLQSSHPATIALNVAAELATLWQADV